MASSIQPNNTETSTYEGLSWMNDDGEKRKIEEHSSLTVSEANKPMAIQQLSLLLLLSVHLNCVFFFLGRRRVYTLDQQQQSMKVIIIPIITPERFANTHRTSSQHSSIGDATD